MSEFEQIQQQAMQFADSIPDEKIRLLTFDESPICVLAMTSIIMSRLKNRIEASMERQRPTNADAVPFAKAAYPEQCVCSIDSPGAVEAVLMVNKALEAYGNGERVPARWVDGKYQFDDSAAQVLAMLYKYFDGTVPVTPLGAGCPTG